VLVAPTQNPAPDKAAEEVHWERTGQLARRFVRRRAFARRGGQTWIGQVCGQEGSRRKATPPLCCVAGRGCFP
jgi:hypothetical protein